MVEVCTLLYWYYLIIDKAVLQWNNCRDKNKHAASGEVPVTLLETRVTYVPCERKWNKKEVEGNSALLHDSNHLTYSCEEDLHDCTDEINVFRHENNIGDGKARKLLGSGSGLFGSVAKKQCWKMSRSPVMMFGVVTIKTWMGNLLASHQSNRGSREKKRSHDMNCGNVDTYILI